MDRYPFRPLFSASSLDAISRCPGASTLARFEVSTDELIRNRRKQAQAGTSEHAAVLTDESLPTDLRWWLTNGEPEWEVFYETRMALDLVWGKTPRAVYLDDKRLDVAKFAQACELKPWAAGTPDVFAVHMSDEQDQTSCEVVRTISVRVADLKTGEGQASGLLPHPASSWQLRFYLLAVLISYHWPTHPQVRLGRCDVSFWTRDYEAERTTQPDVPAEDREHLWQCDEATIDENSLLSALEELTGISQEVAKGVNAHFRQGAWCGRCNRILGCPAHRNAVERLGVSMEQTAGPVALGEAFEALQAVRALVKHVEATIEAWASAFGDVPVQGGVLGWRNTVRRKLSATALVSLDEIRPGLADLVQLQPPSVAAVARALGEKKPGPLVEAVLEELTERDPDAVRLVRSRELRVRRE